MSWMLGITVFLLTAGFAKISAVSLNRLLARPHGWWIVAVSEPIQLASLPIYAWLMYCHLAGTQTPQSAGLLGNVVTPGEIFLLVVGAVGFVLLVRSTIAYQTYQPPVCQIDSESQIIDFRLTEPDQSWKTTLVGPGPMRRIALLPGNEQFTVEVSTKTYSLPRVPKEWDGLSLVQIADSHFRGAVSCRYFQKICERAMALKPDLFVFTGDLLDNLALLDWLSQTFGRLKAPLGQYFVLGNHDWYLNQAEIRQEFERLGWIDLASRSVEIASPKSGPPIVLAGDETPWMGTHPNRASDSNSLFQILLSHTPDNISWARQQGIDLVIAGHTHGGQIRLPFLGPVYSPSLFDCQFASGVFWLEPTLLYVLCGLSGREPIRYQCVPELTKLVLRSHNVS